MASQTKNMPIRRTSPLSAAKTTVLGVERLPQVTWMHRGNLCRYRDKLHNPSERHLMPATTHRPNSAILLRHKPTGRIRPLQRHRPYGRRIRPDFDLHRRPDIPVIQPPRTTARLSNCRHRRRNNRPVGRNRRQVAISRCLIIRLGPLQGRQPGLVQSRRLPDRLNHPQRSPVRMPREMCRSSRPPGNLGTRIPTAIGSRRFRISAKVPQPCPAQSIRQASCRNHRSAHRHRLHPSRLAHPLRRANH